MKLTATQRETKNLEQLREEEGMIPSVLYKKGMDTLLISVPDNIVRSLWKDIKDEQSFTLNLDGTEYTVILKDMQTHPVSGQILHLDFLAE